MYEWVVVTFSRIWILEFLMPVTFINHLTLISWTRKQHLTTGTFDHRDIWQQRHLITTIYIIGSIGVNGLAVFFINKVFSFKKACSIKRYIPSWFVVCLESNTWQNKAILKCQLYKWLPIGQWHRHSLFSSFSICK